ncbi:MAG: guanylate kinase [bacterium]|nr:guanylate kinase [bacterium]
MSDIIKFFETFEFNISKKGHIFVISGFSGVGKGTIINRILQNNPNIYFSISYTTRQKRPTEIDGKDYFFISKEEFKEKILNDDFLEWAIVNEEFYGTSKTQVLEKIENKIDVILDIDVKGAIQVKSKLPNFTTLIYIIPPTGLELLNRLKNRKTETEEQILKRITTSLTEINYINAYDYIVINDDLEECIKQVQIIIETQKLSSKVSTLYISKKILKE